MTEFEQALINTIQALGDKLVSSLESIDNTLDDIDNNLFEVTQAIHGVSK